MTPFKVRIIIFLRILDNVTIFSENWNTANTGLLLTSNMFALSSETRVKNGYHIYILNWKLGNSHEKKRILPQRAQYLWGGGIQVINCICQLSLLCCGNKQLYKSLFLKTMNLLLIHTTYPSGVGWRSALLFSLWNLG